MEHTDNFEMVEVIILTNFNSKWKVVIKLMDILTGKQPLINDISYLSLFHFYHHLLVNIIMLIFRSKLPKIRVVVRKRPRSQKEINKNDQDIVDMYEPQTIVVKELKQKVDLTKYIEEHQFIFDQVFEDEISNQDFYVQTVQPLVSALFLGSKVT